MLVHRVAANADCAVLCHVCPEVCGCCQVFRGCGILFADALHTDVFRHLCLGMLVVEERFVHCLHAVEHLLVGVFSGCFQVFLVTENLVSVNHGFVHAAMFYAEHGFHVLIAHLADEVDTPVG